LRSGPSGNLSGMAKYDLGYGGEWKETFRDGEAAIRRAEELAEGGKTAEVARRFLGLHAFVTAFPESGREKLRARRGAPYVGELWGFGVSGEAHHGHGGPPGDHAGGGSGHSGSHDGGGAGQGGGHDGGSAAGSGGGHGSH
jgi:hypothetical protein